MIPVIIIHYGEIALKGNNRWLFEEKLVENIKEAFGSLSYKSIRRISGRILVYLDSTYPKENFSISPFEKGGARGISEKDSLKLSNSRECENEIKQEKYKEALNHVFGITSFSFAWEVEADLEMINKTLEDILRLSLREEVRGSHASGRSAEGGQSRVLPQTTGSFGLRPQDDNSSKKQVITFRITTRRSDKKFPMISEEMNRQIGEYILEKTDLGLKVKLIDPDINCFIEIVEGKALIYLDKIPGLGGMPAGVNGKVVSMISSGFDSPVASWQLMKRGAEVIFVHFHSFPRTSRASIDNVKNIIKILNKYQFGSTLYLVPFFEIQKEILTKASQDYRIILYRRMMFRIAEQIARENKARALVTGESLGQVASQTLENIEVISSVVRIPIFRPLIGTDKIDIMNMAQKIGTYDISKLPYEDCCSLFVPKHPKTKARIDEVEFIEKDFDIEKMSKTAMSKIEKQIF